MPRPHTPKLTKLEIYQMARSLAVQERSFVETAALEWNYWNVRVKELDKRINLIFKANARKEKRS